jgi:hypothetical protein
MLCKEMIPVYYENHTNAINTLGKMHLVNIVTAAL